LRALQPAVEVAGVGALVQPDGVARFDRGGGAEGGPEVPGVFAAAVTLGAPAGGDVPLRRRQRHVSEPQQGQQQRTQTDDVAQVWLLGRDYSGGGISLSV